MSHQVKRSRAGTLLLTLADCSQVSLTCEETVKQAAPPAVPKMLLHFSYRYYGMGATGLYTQESNQEFWNICNFLTILYISIQLDLIPN